MSTGGSGLEPTTIAFHPPTDLLLERLSGVVLESKLIAIMELITFIDKKFYRKGEPQPDNYEGIKHGPINAENNIGITIEGLQEFHDEACLAVLNNKYNDGVAWHDVACHFR